MDDLKAIRLAYRTRLKGAPWKDVAKTCGVSTPTARKLVARYHEHRKAGTLFSDMPGEDADWYRAPIYRMRTKPTPEYQG